MIVLAALLTACSLIPDEKRSDLLDPDGDGYNFDEDCGEGDPTVHPGAEEVCSDGVVNDCGDGANAELTCGPDPVTAAVGEPSRWLGYSVLGGVDLTGDQVLDVAAGAPGQVWTGQDSGQVWIVDGASGDALVVEAISACDSGAICDFAGYSVGAGDLDGDGAADLLVGAPYAGLDTDAGGYFGEVFGLLGPLAEGASLASPDVALVPDDVDRLGTALISYAPDPGGATWLALGALYGRDGSEHPTGAVYLVSGERALEDGLDQAAVLLGTATNDMAGASVASAGDVDGDGAEDLLVGGPQLVNGGAGAAWLINEVASAGLVSTLNAWSAVRFDGESEADGLGLALSGAGDMNEDGYGDLVLGAPGSDCRAATDGAIYLIWGGSDLEGGSVADVSGATICGTSGSSLGWSVAAVGDTDADGLSELVVGAPFLPVDAIAEDGDTTWDACGLSTRGGQHVVIAGDDYDGVNNVESASAAVFMGDDTCTGFSVSSAGDLDGDGRGDLALGDPFALDQAGAVWTVAMTSY